jgi:CheY-like chemotaxis protein
VTQRLLDREPDRRSILVALTGYGDGSNIERAREAGFDHFIIKPASRRELSELLESAA